MVTLQYSVDIKASAQVTWEHLWKDASYRKWTSAFMEGSYAQSTWEQGAKIYFLTPSGEGMYGVIDKLVPQVEMTFKHQGEIKAGVEENKNWQHASESYKLEEKNGATTVNVTLTMDDAHKDYENYFNEAFPKALSILKEICEN